MQPLIFIIPLMKEFCAKEKQFFCTINQILLWNQCMNQQMVFILPLHFNCSQSFISKFTLLIQFQCLLYHINSLVNITSPLQL